MHSVSEDEGMAHKQADSRIIEAMRKQPYSPQSLVIAMFSWRNEWSSSISCDYMRWFQREKTYMYMD